MRPIKMVLMTLSMIATVVGIPVQIILLIMKALQALGVFELAWLAPIASVQFWIPAIIIIVLMIIGRIVK